MEQFEKVVKGLEELRNFADTKVHPIVSPENWGIYSDLCDLIDEFGTDALALIRQQRERIAELEAGRTARVMTLEEANEADAVWIEVLGNVRIIPARINVLDGVAIVFKFIATQEKASLESYGAEWRCWTQRPTDKQREAVKWE